MLVSIYHNSPASYEGKNGGRADLNSHSQLLLAYAVTIHSLGFNNKLLEPLANSFACVGARPGVFDNIHKLYMFEKQRGDIQHWNHI